ncbi:hypothetical protein D3C71_2241960 [compost metagenome]
MCPIIPEWLVSIGYWYQNFEQTSDQEVIDLLQRAWQREAESSAGPEGQANA